MLYANSLMLSAEQLPRENPGIPGVVWLSATCDASVGILAITNNV